MEQTQPHGNFVAFMNRQKQPGDNKPTFDGRLSLPDAESELRLALWSHEYTNPETGEVQIMFNGRTDAVVKGDAPMAQVAALTKGVSADDMAMVGNLDLSPRQVVLFPNKYKDDEPDKERPDYWGAFNPGNGEPVVRISAWARKDRNQHAMLSGATSYPIPGKSEDEQQVAQDELKGLVESGAVTKGVKKAKAKDAGVSR